MSKTVRIRTTPNANDSYLKVKVEQDFDFIEILSLKISQAEAYSRFCSDYGVVVGRVTVNDGFGIPNAKVSIFIPLTDEDSENSEISGLYPFKVIDDKNSENIRYNLLPIDNNTDNNCFTPVGSFPSKREVIDNDTTLEVYCKYYKFTTTTNNAGDFMLFGVPTGNHTLNIDVDLSDIGIASQRPYDFISQGENVKSFETTNKFKGDKDLDKLIQIKSFKKGVNVQPFWGDKDQCDIGITRLDFDVKKKIIPSAIFIGSLFTDSEKNSINKNCRPRKDFGRLCETETGEGTVEMIRKTIDGKIERYDIEGGRVINDSGSWAYQVPMNLDFMITDEFGNLVPSNDPNKGIPTRASVRFRIGKDISGSEGRLRTTAKYLVPHNPPNKNKIDYNFNENTSDEHFRDFHWNKIYTVSNFIPRIQPVCGGGSCADNRNMTGIKDVDDCVGDKVPFPYNRVDTDFNPLFLIICIILSIIVFVVWMINSIVIALINIIINTINNILEVICRTIWSLKFLSINKNKHCKYCIGNKIKDGDGDCIDCGCKSIIKYVPCIVLECDEKGWAPGCDCSDSDAQTSPVGDTEPDNVNVGSLGCWAATTNPSAPKNIVHWSGLSSGANNCGHTGHNTIGAGVTDCYAIQLAEALNIFELDFYNDWINGTLYTYLLKYKKKKTGKQKFCDTDCNTPDSDNGCDTSYWVDTLKDSGDDRNDVKKTVKESMKEGFIKQITNTLPGGLKQETLYYAPYSSDKNFKLFATELVHLGSIFDCDWQGIPKLQPLLVPTTYKRPPYTAEYLDDNTTKITCGMTSTGGNGSGGLFFDIDCIGLTVGQGPFGGPRSNNIKRICEFGVDIDQAELGANNNVIAQANCFINEKDIDQPYGSLFRNVFYQLNINDGPTKLNSWPAGGMSPTIDTGFGVSANSISPNQYTQFRGGGGNGYITPDPNNYTQTNNSYYFYFGIKPGITAIDIMNSRFFNECTIVEKNDFIVSGIIGDISGTTCDGTISTTVVGGNAPYSYSWIGPNGFSLVESIGDITNLCGGIYTVTVTDANGGTSTNTFTVNQPAAFSCDVFATNSILYGGTGDLFINANGGVPPYSYSINSSTPVSMGTESFLSLPKPAGTYVVTISDSNGLSCTNTGVTISQPALLTLGNSVVWSHTTCGIDNGSITINNPTQANLGGIPPYTFSISGPSGSVSSTSYPNIASGTYTVFVSDGSPTAQTTTQTVTINQSVGATINITPNWYCWPDPQVQATINAQINATFNGGSYSVVATPLNALGDPTTPTIQLNNITTSSVIMTGLKDLRYNFNLTDALGCTNSEFSDFRPSSGQVPSTPLTLNWLNTTDKFCWVSPSPVPLVNLQFVVSGVDGPFTIVGGGITYTSGPVLNGTIITLPTLTAPIIGAPMPFVITETTHGCSKTTNITLTSGTHVPTSPLAISINIPTHNCLGVFSISANAIVSGGWSPYTYNWSNGPIVTQANCGQLITCTVTDNQGCFKVSNTITV